MRLWKVAQWFPKRRYQQEHTFKSKRQRQSRCKLVRRCMGCGVMCLIEFHKVSFSYEATPDTQSLSSVSFSVNAGECVLLTGTSGSGKSTILRLLNGLIPEFYHGHITGSVCVHGKNAQSSKIEDKAGVIGSVFQNPRTQFFTVDTTSELAFGLENLAVQEHEIIDRIRATVQNFHIEVLMDRNIFELSGGEKQQIACASIDVLAPEIILLDEPSANLDYEAAEHLRALIAYWKQAGKTILIAEHRINYVWDLADRAFILEQGTLARELTKREMLHFTDDDAKHCGLRSLKRVSPLCLDTLNAGGGNTGGGVDAGAGDTGGGVGAGEDGTDVGIDAGGRVGAGGRTHHDQTLHHNNFIFLKNFSYSYCKNKTLFSIKDMKIYKGHVTAIVGGNGAGKTTFLETICGIRKNKGGMIVDGTPYTCKQRAGTIFMVMQDVNHQLFTESVLDEVLISQSHADKHEAKQALLDVELDSLYNRHPMSLSGGQKQRLALACAIASQAPILLLDEPTSGLDRRHMQMVARILNHLKHSGRTIITVTHDSEFIECCCDDILHMETL